MYTLGLQRLSWTFLLEMFISCCSCRGDDQEAVVHERILLKQRLTSEQSQFSLLADDLYVGLLFPAFVAG